MINSTHRCDKIPDRKQPGEGGFILACNLRRDTVYHGRRERHNERGMGQLVTFHTQAGSREHWMLVFSLCSPFESVQVSIAWAGAAHSQGESPLLG